LKTIEKNRTFLNLLLEVKTYFFANIDRVILLLILLKFQKIQNLKPPSTVYPQGKDLGMVTEKKEKLNIFLTMQIVFSLFPHEKTFRSSFLVQQREYICKVFFPQSFAMRSFCICQRPHDQN
jgi:hypothetical protein